MGALADARLALKGVLTGQVLSGGVALKVLDLPPSAVMPPALMLEPADPWWSMNERLPAHMAQARWDVLVVAAKGTQEAMTAALEALADQVLDAVLGSPHGWTVEAVSGPLNLTLAQDTYPALRITVVIPARLTAA